LNDFFSICLLLFLASLPVQRRQSDYAEFNQGADGEVPYQTGGNTKLLGKSRHNPGVGMLAKIMDPRRPSFRVHDGALFEQGLQRLSQACAAVSAPTAGSIPDKSCVRGTGEFPLASRTQATIKLIGDASIDRKQAGFIELRFSNVQSRFCLVVVAHRQAQKFPTPDSGGEQ
jgi:hypothetical protein